MGIFIQSIMILAMALFQRRTKTTKFQGAKRPEILWFWSKWVYKFLPAKKQKTCAPTLYNIILSRARNFLETRENGKISTHPVYHINLDWFSWEWSKKKIQNGRFSKMAIFQNRQFSKFFRENFTDSSLG